MESAAIRDAITSRAGLFQAVFEIHPAHNPLGPFDFAGCYDERSDRVQPPVESATSNNARQGASKNAGLLIPNRCYPAARSEQERVDSWRRREARL